MGNPNNSIKPQKQKNKPRNGHYENLVLNPRTK